MQSQQHSRTSSPVAVSSVGSVISDVESMFMLENDHKAPSGEHTENGSTESTHMGEVPLPSEGAEVYDLGRGDIELRVSQLSSMAYNRSGN